MGITINLDSVLVNEAKNYSVIQHRSVPKQIEHWATIGRIAEENPDLNYGAILGILRGLEDMKAGRVEKYRWHRGCLRD